MSKTKIVVLHLKEIIYTAIFVGLGILLILLLIFMFAPKGDQNSSGNTKKYKAGVYNSELLLNNATLNLEVVLDEDQINSIRFVNLDESVTTMYPLIQPALDDISNQLLNNVPLENVTISDDCRYTQTIILETIESTLKKATP